MKSLRTVIITGVSGAGKTTALHAVEDLGFYCVDNLPLPLLNQFIETMMDEPTVSRAALVVDARLRQDVRGYAEACTDLQARGVMFEVLYLDARDDVLVRRFSQTRRPHPLNSQDLMLGLQAERRILSPLRAHAQSCIDTSDLSIHELKRVIQDRYHQGEQHGLVVSLLSFGFRYGIPAHADVVMDVRFLTNPYFVSELRPMNGTDAPVAAYVLEQPDAQEFLDRTEGWLRFLLPRYQTEGKVYLTVAVGCTGGKHRSVALAEALAQRLKSDYFVRLNHRDVAHQVEAAQGIC